MEGRAMRLIMYTFHYHIKFEDLLDALAATYSVTKARYPKSCPPAKDLYHTDPVRNVCVVRIRNQAGVAFESVFLTNLKIAFANVPARTKRIRVFKKQKSVACSLLELQRLLDRVPTYKELGQYEGISRQAAHNHVRALMLKGILQRKGKKFSTSPLLWFGDSCHR